MIIGTAAWSEGGIERRALVAPLPGDPERWVDLNRVERVRLAKQGEGRSEVLAEALLPPSLRQVLEGGVRTLQRIRQTLAYAEKWHARHPLPDSLAPHRSQTKALPCLPRPAALVRADGSHLDRLRVRGPGATLQAEPRPTMALVGAYPGKVAGVCLALEDGPGAVLGQWLLLDTRLEGVLHLSLGDAFREVDLAVWHGLGVRSLRPGEVLLLPPPEWQPLPPARAGAHLTVRVDFEAMPLRLWPEGVHPTVQ